tara:strand:+ start:473 stop:619 length:147 start_codon:yes stop_codon:yes gene_type:complete
MSCEEFIGYLDSLLQNHGRLACLNFLTMTQEMSLPDAQFFFDTFVRGN